MKALKNAYKKLILKETKTMILRKTLSSILAVAMLGASAVMAEEDIMLISENPAEDIMVISPNPFAEEEVVVTEPLMVEYDKVELYGEAKVEEDGLYIIDEAEISEVFLNTDDNTVFVDALGYKTSIEAIETGASLKVIASNAMTMSIPPQSYAYVVMMADENGAFPIYAEVKSVETDEDSNLVFPSKDGKYNIVYGAELTEVAPFATRNIVTASDIKEGSRILVYSDIMTMSLPAVVPADKIVILPEITEELEVPSNVTVNGEEVDTLDAQKVFEKDGMWLLPVRAICEKVGLEVKWDSDLNSISVGTIPMGVTFNLGENSYTKARMMPQTLSSAPICENERTYVPVDFFTEILDAQISIENGTLDIKFN